MSTFFGRIVVELNSPSFVPKILVNNHISAEMSCLNAYSTVFIIIECFQFYKLIIFFIIP